MKFSVAGALRLKPFDESADGLRHGERYSRAPLLAAGVIAAFVFAIAGLILAMAGHSQAMNVLLLAIALSAITSGIEWHAGMCARALNQLFAMVLCAGVASIIVARS
jgi:hypothetical protein